MMYDGNMILSRDERRQACDYPRSSDNFVQAAGEAFVFLLAADTQGLEEVNEP